MSEIVLPRYKCHKEVNAAKIRSVVPIDGDGSAILYFEESGDWRIDSGNMKVVVDQHFMAKHNPSAGGYYIIYNDGYTSWSPAEAFEEGYSIIEEES